MSFKAFFGMHSENTADAYIQHTNIMRRRRRPVIILFVSEVPLVF